MPLTAWQSAQAEGRDVTNAEIICFTSDALGNLLAEENDGGTISHQYDAPGNLTSTRLPDGRELSCLRYGTGHLLQMNLKHGGRLSEIAGYQRDKLHRETGRSQGALHQETRYDPAGRIVMRRSGFGGRNAAVLERRYRWDRLDQVMQQQVTDSSTGQSEWANRQQRFGYDATGQVTREVRPFKEAHFTWDAAGNRTDKPGDIVWHNLLKRLKGARWRYDGFGRMTWRRAAEGAPEQHFTYDDEHRVTEVRFDGDREYIRAEYRYDALGRRTQKILHRHGKEAETISFLWSGLRMVGERSSLQPARNTQYIYSEGSWEPVARVDSIGGQSETFWYHTELNGLPERMTDERGEVVWRGRFSTWGETEQENSTGFQAVQQNLRFQGQYLDRETGLHYNLFRYYDPVGGRFTQVDPIGLAGGLNLYAYAPNPLNWIDPLGLSECGATHKNPDDIHFMQSSIRNQTGEHTVLDNAAALRKGTLKPTDLPPIKVWEDQAGKIWTLDHRRLAAFKLSGLKEIPVQWATPKEISGQMWKMTTRTGGKSIILKMGDGVKEVIGG